MLFRLPGRPRSKPADNPRPKPADDSRSKPAADPRPGSAADETVPTRRLAAIASAIAAYVEAEGIGYPAEGGGFRVTAVRGPWTTEPGGAAGFGWAAAGRWENMLGRQQLATRRGTSPR